MRTINKIIIIALGVLAFSCEDILEEDISNDTVQLISPLNGIEVESNVASFKWNSLNGADDYRLQLYDANQVIILDSLVENKTSLTYPLSPGNYQWRVRGENAGYKSIYSLTASFSMAISDDLTGQQVILTGPMGGIYTKNTTLTCAWQDLSPADYYKIELVNVTAGNIIVHQESNITDTSFLLDNTMLSADAKYEWKIKAVNANSETVFSSRFFYVDRAVPNASQNITPADGSTQNDGEPIEFTWTVPSDTGTIHSPISYSIEFSNTVGFNSIIRTSPSTDAAKEETITIPGDYYWRVKTTDGALNSSTYSTPFKFIID